MNDIYELRDCNLGKSEYDRRYQITQAQAQKFEQALERMLQTPEEERKTSPLLWQAQISAIESQLSDLREEMKVLRQKITD